MCTLSENMTMKQIGSMRSVFHYKNGTPRQSSLCEAARGVLTIDKGIFNNPEHSLEGLQQFSHAWIIFVFHKNNNVHTKAKVKPPRLDGQKVGVFSTRSPYRPNNIGLSLAKIDKVEGSSIHFSGIDLLDGTPVLDIKPYIPDYDKPKDSFSFIQSEEMKEVYAPDGVVKSTLVRPDCMEHACTKVQEKTIHAVHDAGDDNVVDDIVDSDLGGTDCKYCLDLKITDDLIQQIGTESCLQYVTDSCIQSSTDSSIQHVTDNCMQSCNNSDTVDKTSSENITFPKQNKTFYGHGRLGKFSGETTHKTNTETISSVVAPWLLNPPVVKLIVTFTHEAMEQLKKFSQRSSDPDYRLHMIDDADEAMRSIVEIIQEDPRSVYRRQHCPDNLYYLTLDVLHITCWFDDVKAQVVRVKPVALVTKLMQR